MILWNYVLQPIVMYYVVLYCIVFSCIRSILLPVLSCPALSSFLVSSRLVISLTSSSTFHLTSHHLTNLFSLLFLLLSIHLPIDNLLSLPICYLIYQPPPHSSINQLSFHYTFVHSLNDSRKSFIISISYLLSKSHLFIPHTPINQSHIFTFAQFRKRYK